MLTSKQMNIKPLLDSTEGVHLTAYLINRGDLIDLKNQLKETIEESLQWLTPVMTVEERNKFLEPIESLLHDARIFKHMKGNIGIFRSQNMFRVLNIPISVEKTCHVASSFHVKPLLKWLQSDQDFLFLGLEKNAAHLYLGNNDSIKLIDSILFPEFFKNKNSAGEYISMREARKYRIRQEEAFTWLNDWIAQLTIKTKPKLFLAGDESLLKGLYKKLEYTQLVKTPVLTTFNQMQLSEICRSIRKILKIECEKLLELSLLEFRFAEEGNRTSKNIFQISKAVIRGKVRKLIVTDELNIFGKIDRKTGGLAIHPVDLDHEDDDILDDLAQMVLSQGGEVVIAKRNEIPKGRPILAILDDQGKILEKSEALKQYETLQERFG